MIGEKQSAIDEIDYWLRRHSKNERNSTVKPHSAEYRYLRIMRMRAEYWAGRLLFQSPKFATVGARRYRRALEAMQEFLISITWPKTFQEGTTLKFLVPHIDSQNAAFVSNGLLCHDMPTELKRLLIAGISMINSITYIGAVNGPQLPHAEHRKFMIENYKILGSIAPECFKDTLKGDSGLFFLSAVTDTYLVAKLSLFQDLPEERIKSQLCEIGTALDRATEYVYRLKQAGQDKANQSNYWAAEIYFETARPMQRSLIAFRKLISRYGARAC